LLKAAVVVVVQDHLPLQITAGLVVQVVAAAVQTVELQPADRLHLVKVQQVVEMAVLSAHHMVQVVAVEKVQSATMQPQQEQALVAQDRLYTAQHTQVVAVAVVIMGLILTAQVARAVAVLAAKAQVEF
jgi:hypothetical protein